MTIGRAILIERRIHGLPSRFGQEHSTSREPLEEYPGLTAVRPLTEIPGGIPRRLHPIRDRRPLREQPVSEQGSSSAFDPMPRLSCTEATLRVMFVPTGND